MEIDEDRKKQLREEESLWFYAVGKFLDKSDFDVSDWLNEEDLSRYREVRRELFGEEE